MLDLWWVLVVEVGCNLFVGLDLRHSLRVWSIDMGETLLSASNHERLNVLLGAEQQQGVEDRWELEIIPSVLRPPVTRIKLSQS
jgi:hypothetical protein